MPHPWNIGPPGCASRLPHGTQLPLQPHSFSAGGCRGFPLCFSPGGARVFLGIVLPIDGVPGLRRRHATASRYLSDFGVAMYCGFGRQPGADGTQTMREHARVVRAVRKTS